jgi:ubiquinone/menaquinone biosynthesis C-methylase UbiE
MAPQTTIPKLQLIDMPRHVRLGWTDPLRWYSWPVLGTMYRRRVELCLAECAGGDSILEVGFGSGLTFQNLHKLYREIYGLDLDADVTRVTELFQSKGILTHLQNGSVLKMPYADQSFDTVLLISILEHLKPFEQEQASREIHRVLKPGGQMIYGVPIERPLMVFMFRLMGFNIREHHFSTERDVENSAARHFRKVSVTQMLSVPSCFGAVYEVGHFVKD